MAENNLPIHPRERLPQHAVPLPDTRPEVNFQYGRFFISGDEFEFRINSLCSQFIKIQAFAKFVRDNHKKIINGRVVSGDLAMFSDFLSMFLTREFVDPKGKGKGMIERYVVSTLLNFLLCLIFVDCNLKIISKVLMCCCYKGEFS